MDELLSRLADAIERGKVDRSTPYPPDMNDEDGVSELIQEAVKNAVPPQQILTQSLMTGMNKIGKKFSTGEAFIPDLLMSARAMNKAMEYLKPFFEAGEAEYKGKIIVGTVAGDLHEIGKNIVRMVVEGGGWKVTDLGVDVTAEKFMTALEDNPGSSIGMSALLTTTMLNMEKSTVVIKREYPGTPVYIGGAPVSQEFSLKIGADGYFPDPYLFIQYLEANSG